MDSTGASRVTPSSSDGVIPAPTSKALEIASALGALVFLGALAFLARRIELRTETGGIDPRWWPELLGTFGVVVAVALLVVSVLRRPTPREDVEPSTRAGFVRVVITIALTAAFLLAWPFVGFLVAAAVFLLAVTVVFGGRGWRVLILFPLLTTAFIYLLFDTLLEVPL
ncbi:tripartite tricarboxylate transporter TctB family protein [Isoptericola croceus]|uniref:tripartite tricarboxylate transporter TctB family protein n=1 Tax=Isoptericola croceus TaxID=3031406 RepID=UPI0023FA12E0|nr:tripartite tricarboxylate transporter TctB family protein [Isoptericola croceus]